MGKTIDLDAALDALTDYCENKCIIREDAWCPDCQYEAFKGVLKALPSAQPEHKIVHWIELKTFLGRGVICSECGKLALHQVWSDGRGEIQCEYAKPNFCPSCGAKMEEQDVD